MLLLTIPEREFYFSETQEFYKNPELVLMLEHSLLSASKWESKYKKPFISKTPMTQEEMIDYIRMMCLSTVLDERIFDCFTDVEFQKVQEYIDDSQTATTFNDLEKKRFSTRVITTEVIYYWMVSLGIPFECEKWPLNRLLTLIRVCTIKNGGAKKMSKNDIYKRNQEINERNKRLYHTRG